MRKEKYVNPIISSFDLVLEHCLAAGSAQATFNGPSNGLPTVDAWEVVNQTDDLRDKKENW